MTRKTLPNVKVSDLDVDPATFPSLSANASASPPSSSSSTSPSPSSPAHPATPAHPAPTDPSPPPPAPPTPPDPSPTAPESDVEQTSLANQAAPKAPKRSSPGKAEPTDSAKNNTAEASPKHSGNNPPPSHPSPPPPPPPRRPANGKPDSGPGFLVWLAVAVSLLALLLAFTARQQESQLADRLAQAEQALAVALSEWQVTRNDQELRERLAALEQWARQNPHQNGQIQRLQEILDGPVHEFIGAAQAHQQQQADAIEQLAIDLRVQQTGLRLSIALLQLRIESSLGQPFGEAWELVTLHVLNQDLLDSEAVTASLDDLAPYRYTGIPPLSTLQQDLSKMVAARATEPENGSGNWLDYAWTWWEDWWSGSNPPAKPQPDPALLRQIEQSLQQDPITQTAALLRPHAENWPEARAWLNEFQQHQQAQNAVVTLDALMNDLIEQL